VSGESANDHVDAKLEALARPVREELVEQDSPQIPAPALAST